MRVSVERDGKEIKDHGRKEKLRREERKEWRRMTSTRVNLGLVTVLMIWLGHVRPTRRPGVSSSHHPPLSFSTRRQPGLGARVIRISAVMKSVPRKQTTCTYWLCHAWFRLSDTTVLSFMR